MDHSHNDYFTGLGDNKIIPFFNSNGELPYDFIIPLGINSYYKTGVNNLLVGFNGSLEVIIAPGAGEPNFDYACPHNSYYIVGEHISGFGMTFGLEGGILLPVSENFKIFPTVGLGVSMHVLTSTLVGRSISTGWTYDQGSGSNGGISFTGDYLIKLGFIFDFMSLSVGFSKNRGLIYGLGVYQN